MKKAKVIVVTSTDETLVATVKSTIEAFQFAALLQALVIGDTHTYYVDFYDKDKRTIIRRQPDSITQTITNCKSLYDAIRPVYLGAI